MLWKLVTMVGGGLAVASLLGLLTPFGARVMADLSPDVSWLLDLIANWQWVFAAVIFVAGLLLGLTRRRFLFLSLAALLPFVTAAPRLEPGGKGPGVTVVSANLEYRNRNPVPLMRWAEQQRADIIVLSELSPNLALGLAVEKERYPFQRLRPDKGASGIGIISRHPIVSWKVRPPRSRLETQRIDAEIEIDGRIIKVSAIHPKPPLNPELNRARNDSLRSTIADQSGRAPALVIGDLNATPWSTAFSRLADKGWRRAMGLRATWPTKCCGWIGVPIDQVLANDQWALVDATIGPDIGSDHLPIAATMRLK